MGHGTIQWIKERLLIPTRVPVDASQYTDRVSELGEAAAIAKESGGILAISNAEVLRFHDLIALLEIGDGHVSAAVGIDATYDIAELKTFLQYPTAVLTIDAFAYYERDWISYVKEFASEASANRSRLQLVKTFLIPNRETTEIINRSGGQVIIQS